MRFAASESSLTGDLIAELILFLQNPEMSSSSTLPEPEGLADGLVLFAADPLLRRDALLPRLAGRRR